MRRIEMPQEAKKIIDKLYAEGYEAYIVGGCVRDNLIGRTPDDYDITTSAPPEETKRIFERTIDTGIKHGTVTVIENGKPYEVTTFRVDGEYKDNRHPVSISFTKNIKDDLARRDFTVNALAYNDRVGIVDAFSGLDDLEAGVIRCVRNPEERFAEDALRVLRGIRFSSVLDFEIEENTADAILKFAQNLRYVSSERIYVEWKKLLSGVKAYEIILRFKEVIDVFISELKDVEVPDRDSFNGLDYVERQVLLFSACKGQAPALFAEFAKRIKMDSKTRDTSVSVLNAINELAFEKNIDVRAFVIGKSDDVALMSAKIAAVTGIIKEKDGEAIKRLVREDAPRKISQLDINGNDLLAYGIKGANVGKILNKIIYLVATAKLANEKAKIIEFIQSQEK